MRRNWKESSSPSAPTLGVRIVFVMAAVLSVSVGLAGCRGGRHSAAGCSGAYPSPVPVNSGWVGIYVVCSADTAGGNASGTFHSSITNTSHAVLVVAPGSGEPVLQEQAPPDARDVKTAVFDYAVETASGSQQSGAVVLVPGESATAEAEEPFSVLVSFDTIDTGRGLVAESVASYLVDSIHSLPSGAMQDLSDCAASTAELWESTDTPASDWQEALSVGVNTYLPCKSTLSLISDEFETEGVADRTLVSVISSARDSDIWQSLVGFLSDHAPEVSELIEH